MYRPDGAVVSFGYDALGRRIWKNYRQTTTHWHWDGNVPLHEWKGFVSKDALSENLITWVFEEDSFSPIAKVKGNKYYSILADHLGTPIEMYQDDGSLFWERQLNANGKVLKETQQGSCPFLYQGQYYDAEIELAYNRFRYYDVEDGRYISQDPIGLLSGEFGFYNYVEDTNDWLDVYGLSSNAYVKNGVLKIKNKFAKNSAESKQLKKFVKEWNKQIKKNGGSMTRQSVSKKDRRKASYEAKKEKVNNPSLYQNGEVAGHISDVGWGGDATGPFMPLDSSVNSYVGGLTQGVNTGTSYTSVVLF